jgi:HK97 gp10 family phage protein
VASTRLSFGAQIDNWVRESEQRMTAVFRESTKRTISIAQSNVPVDTGFLRASIRASLAAMPHISEEKPSPGSYVPPDLTMTIAGAKIGETIYVGYTASYAGYVEYGTSKMAPRAFVGQAAIQWPEIVKKVVDDLKGRVAGVGP